MYSKSITFAVFVVQGYCVYKIRSQYTCFSPIISLVDDIFAVFNSGFGDLTFFNYINNKRNNNKFSFLDVLLDNVSPSLKTSVCIKRTFNDLLTGFNRFTSFSYKPGFVNCLMWSCGRAVKASFS